MTDRYPREDPSRDPCSGRTSTGSDDNTNHRRNEVIQVTSKDGVTDILSFDSIWSEDDAEVPSHLARLRDLLTGLFESHFVGCMQFRWTATDRCEVSAGGAVLPVNLIQETITDPRYDNHLVSILTHHREPGFQMKYGAPSTSISTTHCDGSLESNDACLGECPDDTVARFADPVLDNWDVDPTLSMDPIVTVATVSLDRDFVNPEEIFFSSKHEYDNADCDHCCSSPDTDTGSNANE
jgi:hypothetical protein